MYRVFAACVRDRARDGLRGLALDEAGGGTAMGIFWFIMMVGICGLAVDVTDDLRNSTMLQATADSPALSAAIDLPAASAAKGAAVVYAGSNIGTGLHGSVHDTQDVLEGKWARRR